MSMTRITVTLPDELETLISTRVKSGAYASKSEVVRDALRHWQKKNDRFQAVSGDKGGQRRG